MAKIDELPEEILVLIFRRFDLLERLQMRSVCLRWKWIIESIKIREVSVVDSLFNRSQCWDYIGLESLNCQNLIYYSEEPPSLYERLMSLVWPELTGSLQLLSQHPMFSTLKSLFISFNSIPNFRFEKYINPHFPQLEQFSCMDMNVRTTCLSLPNLKVLSLFSSHNAFTKIRLELPNMYKFVTNLSLDLFEFTHPWSVTHLFLSEDDESIVRLSNLEYFSCERLRYEWIIFSKLVKLKEIHLKITGMRKERFAEIYQAKQALNRYDLKMFVREVDYETLRQPFSWLRFKDVIGAYVSGKMRTSPVIQMNAIIVYEDLLDAFGGRAIPSELKTSFPSVRTIIASSRARDDVHSFFSLLANYPNFFILELNSAFDGLGYEQACYDSLPSLCKYLRELKVHWSYDRTTPINLNFVLGFAFLQKLEINQKVRSNFIQLLFERLKYFRFICTETEAITK